MADHYEEGARYILTEDMPRWMGCFIRPRGTEVLKRKDRTRPAPLYISTTETEIAAGAVVTVERAEMEIGQFLYSVVQVGGTTATDGAMFG